jgi:hypothetical protein
MLKHYTHGEVNFFETKELPKNLKKIEVKDNFYIVGESETHGNDHRVAVLDKQQIDFFEDENGTLYMRNLVETNVFCPNENRHDTITLQPGIWEIDKSMEYDYLEQELRQVRD